ncbi:MAG: flagellar basal body P-ring formation chaperone FlgA [Spirochaetia bacterium]
MGNGSDRIAALVFIVLTCCSGAAAADLRELHARQVIAPDADKITIHDFFIVTAEETAERLTLAAQQELEAICGSEAALVPLWQLKGALRSTADTVSVVGRRSVYIPSTIESTVMQSLLEQLLRSLEQEYPAENERLEIEIPRMPGGLRELTRTEGTSDRNLKVELLTLRPGNRSADRAAGDGTASARFLVSAGELQGVLSVEVRRFSPYLSPRRSVARGETLQSDEVERKPFIVGAYPPALTAGRSSTYEIRAKISSEEPLTIRNARIKPVVEAGDAVSVVLKRGAVQLKMPGNARGEAALNERVAVRLDTGIIKECRVLGAGEVILE